MSDDIKQAIARLRESVVASRIKGNNLQHDTDIMEVCFAMEVADKDRAAAIAEAVSKRTVECAETLKAFCVERHIWFAEGGLWRCGYDAILALNTPAPVYPFEKPCLCWEYSVPDAQAVSQSNWRRLLATHSTYVYLCPDASYCEVCGAARKGS